MRLAGILIAVVSVCVAAASLQPTSPPENRRKEYDADVRKTILELQQFRESASIQIRRGGTDATATLINLNPAINAWYLLKLTSKEGGSEAVYHLENGNPKTRRLLLDEKHPSGIAIMEGNNRSSCDLFDGEILERAKRSGSIYYPLCEGRIYLRNGGAGHRTSLEAATELLRDHVWGGEKIVDLGHVLLGGINRETGTQGRAPPGDRRENSSAPLAAAIDPKYADRSLLSANLGIDLEKPEKSGLLAGAWYAANSNPGVYASLIQPNLIGAAFLQSYRANVNALDGVEASALCYLVAFDLDRFNLAFAVGTTYPGVGWSHQALDRARNLALPGPDGVGSISPLVATGLIAPLDAPKTVATFTGGYKRWHGSFKYGELATRNHGSHYGFVEKGVVLSKLQPGLATVFVLASGSIGMKTWTEADNGLLARVEYARQNGVPLIEAGKPGALVNRWGPGNWSGSEDAHLRTLRAGLALQKDHGKRFLIYAVFSDATPSAMARIFQAYRCDYAMLLDMNALEHTYMALYRYSGARLFVDHLLKGMGGLDKASSGTTVPRFLGYADNRDFFYVMRR
jgi:hypothetical protein